MIFVLSGDLYRAMKGKYICHKDFENLKPINVFFKELENRAKESKVPYLNRHVLFRKKCQLKKCEKAILRVTADDYFKFYINGKFVTQGPPPSYPSRYYYMEIDVSEFLVEGENVFAAHVYYQGLINHVWISADNRSCFWCELLLDGKTALITDENWKCTNHTGYENCGRIGYNTAFVESYISYAKEVDFEKTDFNDSDWVQASVFKYADYNLVKSPLKALNIYDKYPEKTNKTGNTIFYDFGQEAVGYIYARAKGLKGDKIILRYGEELNTDGSVKFEMRCNCRYEEEWVLSGKDDILNQFDYKGFRYLEIILPDNVEIQDVKMLVRHYPFEKKFDYKIKNLELQNILRLCENTVKYGVQEAYLDCPTREKGQYLGDLAVSGRAHVILTGDTTLIKKSLKDFCESTFVCKGMLAVTTSTMNQEIADYSLLFPSIVLWVYKQDKDQEFLKYTLKYVEGIYEYFKAYECEDGLIGGVKEKWNLVDWPYNLRDGYDFPLDKPIVDGEHNVLNAFWIGFLKAKEEIYFLLKVHCEKESNKITESFVRAFYNKETGLFCDSRNKTHSAVHSNVLPLLFGIGTKEKSVKDSLVNFIVSKKLTSMGVYMAYFTLAALKLNGYDDEVLNLTLDGGAWLNMIKEGATTTFEAWGKEQKWNTSLFHPWAVAPLIIFADGIEPY